MLPWICMRMCGSLSKPVVLPDGYLVQFYTLLEFFTLVQYQRQYWTAFSSSHRLQYYHFLCVLVSSLITIYSADDWLSPQVVFGVNDVYDYESDLRNPRKHSQSFEGGVLDPNKHELVLNAATCCTYLVSLSVLLQTYGKTISSIFRRILLTSSIILLAWQYSAPPLRMKELPFFDSCSNGLLVWLVWALGYTSTGNSLWGRSNMVESHKGWLLALCSSGIHALGAAADIEVDGSMEQQTIATFSGVRGAAAFCVLN